MRRRPFAIAPVADYSAARLFWIVAVSVFSAEILVMIVLKLLPPLADFEANLVDASLLLILIFPVLYIFLLRPTAIHISNLQQAQAALSESQARFRSLTEMSSDFYWETDSEHRITVRTESKRETAESVFMQATSVGKRRWEISYLSPDEAGWDAHRKMLDAHLPFRDFEISRLRANGAVHHISISGDPVFDDSGKFRGYHGVGTDITERKRAESNLRLAASVFEDAQEAIVVTDPAGDIVAINRRFAEITGYDSNEAVGRNPRFLKSGKQDVGFYQEMWDLITAQGYWAGELWNKRKNGDVFPVWLSISAVRDRAGKVMNYVGLFTDISQRLEAEQAFREGETRYRTLVENSPVCIHEIGMDGCLTSMNRAGLMMMGVRDECQVQGLPYLDAVSGGDRDRVSALLAKAYAGEASRFEFMASGSGQQVFQSCFIPLRNAEGAVAKLMGITEDITERKQAEMRIRQINADLEHRVEQRTGELEVANHELESFAYSVSHDLRAPLRAIDGFSRLIEGEYVAQLDERGQDYFRRIRGGANRMAALIDDLLKLSRISRQKMDRERVDLSQLVREAAENLLGAEPERRVEWVIAPQIAVSGDRGLLRVALENLIGNAWKYSSKREVARIEFGVRESNGKATYFVRDNGAGFDMAYADKLFKAFHRLHSPGEFPGTGIGLATVKRIIHRHSGEIWAEGKVGEGTTFSFTL